MSDGPEVPVLQPVDTDNSPRDTDGEQSNLDQSPDSAYDPDGTPEEAS